MSLVGLLFPGELRVLQNLGAHYQPKILIDAGSALGAWTEAAKLYCPGARVESFDANTDPPALGAVNGELELVVPAYYPYLASGVASWTDQLQTLKLKKPVPMRRLDSFNFPQIDMLKLDVEGMEWEVLEGLGELKPTLVQFEWGEIQRYRGQLLVDFISFFAKWNYLTLQVDWLGSYGNWLAGPPEMVKALVSS